jgi:hypothetical protein
MSVVPNPSILRAIAYYIGLGKIFIITWAICKVLSYILIIVFLILAVKYSSYIPSNKNYIRYEDMMKMQHDAHSEIDAQKNR